jgi:hypothetical protein
MPPRRISADRAVRELSPVARSLLMTGKCEPANDHERWEEWALIGGTRANHFLDASLEDLWERHAPDLLLEWIAAHPGTRPAAWWVWSGPDADPGSMFICPSVPPEAEQAGILAEAGLLTAGEKRRLKCT